MISTRRVLSLCSSVVLEHGLKGTGLDEEGVFPVDVAPLERVFLPSSLLLLVRFGVSATLLGAHL